MYNATNDFFTVRYDKSIHSLNVMYLFLFLPILLVTFDIICKDVEYVISASIFQQFIFHIGFLTMGFEMVLRKAYSIF